MEYPGYFQQYQNQFSCKPQEFTKQIFLNEKILLESSEFFISHEKTHLIIQKWNILDFFQRS